MATLIRKASLETAEITDAVVIADMRFERNEHHVSTIDFKPETDETTSIKVKSKVDQLKIVDSVFGPLQIGNISITRVSLYALGATFDGQPLSGKAPFSGYPSDLSSTRCSSVLSTLNTI